MKTKISELISTSLDLYQKSESLTIDQILEFGTEYGIKITKSKIAFFHFVNPDQETISLQKWSASTMKICSVPNKDEHYPISKAGVWVECFFERRPVIHNDYKSLPNKKQLPKGHVDIIRELSVPVLANNQVVAILGVGNKKNNYTEDDASLLSLLAENVWNIVRRKKAEDELTKKNIELFQKNLNLQIFNEKHEERNEKLKIANEELEKAKNDAIKRKLLIHKQFEKLQQSEQKIRENNQKLIALTATLKETNNKLIEAKEKAEKSDRLKTGFINNMSHEIRTPLNGILGFSSMLNKKTISEQKREEFVKIIQNSGNQLLRIIDDILEISKLDTNQVQVNERMFCLNELLLEIYNAFDGKSKDARIPFYLRKALHNGQAKIYSDKGKLYKILVALIENSFKFTKSGFIELGYKLKGEKERSIEIYVKDTGSGIAKEKQEVIFNRFAQEETDLTKKAEGLGLGLSIARENAKLLNGSITVESKKGQGATFYVTIPYKTDKATLESYIEKEKQWQPKEDRPTILIVEDEEINFLFLETLLEDGIELDCNIIHARNGKEAVEICKEHSEIELVFMDIKMPVMNGNVATRKIKEFRKKLPIVAQTAYHTKEDRDMAYLYGCDSFIAKPITEQYLNEVIKTYIPHVK